MKHVEYISLLIKVAHVSSIALFSEEMECIERIPQQPLLPEFIPCQISGDYLSLTINAQTGVIENWNPVTAQDIKVFRGKPTLKLAD